MPLMWIFVHKRKKKSVSSWIPFIVISRKHYLQKLIWAEKTEALKIPAKIYYSRIASWYVKFKFESFLMHRSWHVLSDIIVKFICPRTVWNLWIHMCSDFQNNVFSVLLFLSQFEEEWKNLMLKKKSLTWAAVLWDSFVNQENTILIGGRGVLSLTCVPSPNIPTLPSIGAHIVEEVWCF